MKSSPSSASARAANKESQHTLANDFFLPLKTTRSTSITRPRNALNATSPSSSSARAANKELQHAFANESLSPSKTSSSTWIKRSRNFLNNVSSPSSASARAANKESQHAFANKSLTPLKTASTRLKRSRNAPDVSFWHKPQTKVPLLKHLTATFLPNVFTNVFTIVQTSSSSNCACLKHLWVSLR